ncbi:hypothetical protein FACS1894189_2940 [Planctomycetales bacterium]|nr:hypothetical protein FACS1894189_2940 [Planctomycetales bacterium]
MESLKKNGGIVDNPACIMGTTPDTCTATDAGIVIDMQDTVNDGITALCRADGDANVTVDTLLFDDFDNRC